VTLLCGSVDTDTRPQEAVRAMVHSWTETPIAAFGSQHEHAALSAARVGVAGADGAAIVGRAEGGVAIVADARLDNRDELRRALPGLEGSSDDTTILLAAWRRWGADCCAHLIGDFAFAVWDDAAGELFCGRDLVGAKSLYYWAPPEGGFAFASQLAELLAHPDLVRRLDVTAAMDRLLFLHHDTHRTIFRNVYRLSPGHALTVDRRRGAPRTWAHTEFKPATLRMSSLGEWAEGLGSAIERAVADRLGAGGRFGAHLSGGLDSSAVVGVAASELSSRGAELVAISFSAAPGSTVDDESPVDEEFMLAMQERYRLEVRHPDADVGEFLEALRLAAPGMMPPPYRTSSMHRWAAGLGVDVMLSGWGGDEASSFNGRSHLAEMLHRGRLIALARSVRGRSLRSIWGRAVTPNLPDAVIRWIGGRRGDSPANRLAISIANERMARELGAADQLRHPLRTRSTTRGTQLALLRSPHLVERIELWSADASRFGIDYRYPLLDQRVLELALAAPSEAFLHQGVSRWLFRRATEPHLPEKVAWRMNKKDSWSQLMQAAQSAGDVSANTRWVVQHSKRLIAEGNDLGGVLDLAKLRRAVSAIPESGFPVGTGVMARMPLFTSARAVELAAFVAHNAISVD
jgi:asparagine synthase (glutamine-hydrolysing)